MKSGRAFIKKTIMSYIGQISCQMGIAHSQALDLLKQAHEHIWVLCARNLVLVLDDVVGHTRDAFHSMLDGQLVHHFRVFAAFEVFPDLFGRAQARFDTRLDEDIELGDVDLLLVVASPQAIESLVLSLLTRLLLCETYKSMSIPARTCLAAPFEVEPFLCRGIDQHRLDLLGSLGSKLFCVRFAANARGHWKDGLALTRRVRRWIEVVGLIFDGEGVFWVFGLVCRDSLVELDRAQIAEWL